MSFKSMQKKLGPGPLERRPPVPLQSKSTQTLMMDLILEGLRVNDGKINAISFELLGRFGAEPVQRLAVEAANTKNRPEHRVRLLQAIHRIGVISDRVTYLHLIMLLEDKNIEVRAAATKVFEVLRQNQERETTPGM